MRRSKGGRRRKKNNQKKFLWALFAIGVTVGALLLVFYRLPETPIYRVKKPLPAPRQAAKKEEAVKFKVAIVLDDFGYNYKNVEAVFALKRPVTFSILPNRPHSRNIAKRVNQKRYEGILHLPMQAHTGEKQIKPEPDTITTAMSPEGVSVSLIKDIESVPYVRGVSNHQGSMATEDIALIKIIFAELKKRDLYFLDSLVTSRSICRKVARETGVRFARRDVFLDNSEDFGYINGQMRQLIKKAKKTGWAVGIGHDRPATVFALSKLMPEAEKEDIEFVFLSELVR